MSWARVEQDHRGSIGRVPDPCAQHAGHHIEIRAVHDDLSAAVGDVDASDVVDANLTDDRPAVTGPAWPSEKRGAVAR